MVHASRARLAPLLGLVLEGLRNDARIAAGGEETISAEKSRAQPSRLLRLGYIAGRDPGTFEVLHSKVALGAVGILSHGLSLVNERGPNLVSKQEIRRLAGLDPEAAARCAKAYELLTGRPVALPKKSRPQVTGGVRSAVESALGKAFGLPVTGVPIENVRFTGGGFAFAVDSAGYTGEVFARKVLDTWIVAPRPFSKSDVGVVDAQAIEYFQRELFLDLVASAGLEGAAELIGGFAVERALFPGEADPLGLLEEFPMVFSIRNNTGSDVKYFAGFDPTTGVAEILVSRS